MHHPLILQLEWCLRVVLAAALAGPIGWNRERRGRPAGFRTFTLVAMGSALFTIISLYGFPGSTTPDRVASNIVVGIGFLGAGTLLRKESGNVSGLTTAAALWTSAALGTAAGAGLYILAVFTTVMVYIVLAVLRQLEYKQATKGPVKTVPCPGPKAQGQDQQRTPPAP